ncbi:MAG: tRNA guanosine(34) transglycosylase Tgt [Patescibacteria group bacterium]|nr:tRNA guanosine(34) transglycosylase Tgt [Patescibacteria group bacterium]
MLTFDVEKRLPNGRGRAGRIVTPHGAIETPAFIPVGTKATVKALSPEQVKSGVGAQAVLANTYHLYLQPGPDIVREAGGLGKFMGWDGPTFTDSGGFQAFSLQGGMKERRANKFGAAPAAAGAGSAGAGGAKAAREAGRGGEEALAKVDDDGVAFKSVIDGSAHRFTPETSVAIQHAIGADIMFVLDECAPPDAPHAEQARAVRRTTAWAERCLAEHRRLGGEQALFGIVQGGRHEDLRRESARAVGSLELADGTRFDGFGIGGTFEKADMATAVGWVCDELPEGKPRHLLGIGEPADLVLGVENGADTFDCVAPTRMARNGTAYTGEGRVNILNARFGADFGPLDPACACPACAGYSRAYISHLFRAKEMFGATLLSIHNLHFLVGLVARLRRAIIEGTFPELKKELLRSL